MSPKNKKNRNSLQNTRPDQSDIQKRIQLALGYQQNGYLGNAEKIYTDILKYFPDQPDCLHYLGMIHMQRGNTRQAIEYMDKSIQLAPNPVFYCNYGMLLGIGQPEEALRQYQKALEMKPDYAEAWFNMGVIYARLENYIAAEEAYKKAVEFRPGYFKALYNLVFVQEKLYDREHVTGTLQKILDIPVQTAEEYNMLGLALMKIGGSDNLTKADKYFRQAIDIQPDFLEAYKNLGRLFTEGNQIERAGKCFSKILELDPDNLDARVNLAYCLIETDHIDSAQELLESVLKQYPNSTHALCGMGNIKRTTGDFNEALDIYNRTLEIDPVNSEAILGLTYCKKFTESDMDFINKINGNPILDANVNFALGKIFNDIGAYDEAFNYYRIANDKRNNRVNYDADMESEKKKEITRIFTDKFIKNHSQYGNDSELPVFIIGSPRSGTTLTEQIISSHPDVLGAGELVFMPKIVKELSRDRDSSDPNPEFGELSPQLIKKYSEYYLENIKEFCKSESVKRITDKNPSNFQRIGLIKILFPNAKIIHCRRHPLDACLSIYFQSFRSEHRYSFNLKNLGYWYLDYLRLMEHWQQIFGDEILHVDYDDTVNNTETVARKLIDYCGLDWDEKCLEFYKGEREVKTASQWQVRQPIYKTSLERWKRYDKHIGPLKEILREYI